MQVYGQLAAERGEHSSMKCIRFDVCKRIDGPVVNPQVELLNEVHTF